jgi:predicted transcriptional regulator
MTKPKRFSKREREIMDIVYRQGRATAGEIHQAMASAPSYSAVRSTLAVLEDKGHLRHEHEGNRYVYHPVESPETAGMTALEHLVDTFFENSATNVVAALLESKGPQLSATELDELTQLIAKAREEGR